MIIMAPLPVAYFPPPADLAMTDGLRVSMSAATLHRILQGFLHDAVIRGERSQPIRLRLERDVGPDDMKTLRFQALQLRDKFRVEAQLKNRFGLGFARQLAVRDFVGPIAKSGDLLTLLHPK